MGERNYEKAVEKIFNLQFFGIKLGLVNIKNLLGDVGNPQESFKVILVAGTNGKGSVASTLASIAIDSGIRTGLFTSPHLIRFNERFAVDGRMITDDQIMDLADELWSHVDRRQALDDEDSPSPITFFEFATTMACLHFKNEGVQLGIFECGLGGKLDATNALDPILTVFTPISIDHTQYLGDTITAIATEKSGILRQCVPAVVAEQPDEAKTALFARFQELEVPSAVMGRDFDVIQKDGQAWFQDDAGLIGPLETSLPGAYQKKNTTVAVAAARILQHGGIPISDQAILSGPTKVFWPGRLERVAESPITIIDGAHNVAAAELLARSLDEESVAGPTVGVISVMGDKDVTPILEAFAPAFDVAVAAQAKMFRATQADELAGMLKVLIPKVEAETDLQAAIERAREMAGPKGRVVICGSLFLVGEARALIVGVPGDGPDGKWIGVRG